MGKGKRDSVREHRIDMEIIVDCYDESERAMGWFYYLQDKLRFPFRAKCITKRATSPLHAGDEVQVSDMASEEDCEHEMFVLVRWKNEDLAVPLAQLKPIGADAQTVQAVEDWHYWVQQGYEF